VDPVYTEHDFDELLRASKALAVIAAWNELGLFDELTAGARQLDQLPADRRALDITAPVLKHLGLLYGEGDRVAMSDAARELHEHGKLPTARNFDFLRDQAQMTEVLRSGGPVSDEDGDKATDGGTRADDPGQTARFLDMLYQRSGDSARRVRDWLAPLLPERARVFDLGGGHGRYARLFADAGHAATLFDFPYVIDYARAKHGEALEYIGGNFRDKHVDFGGPYDLIILSNVVHGEPDEVNRSLIGRLASALAPGGYIVIKDMFLEENGRDPESAVFFGVTMLFYTRSGRSHTLDRARSWLTDAGLEQPRVSVFEQFHLVRARRQA